MLRRSVVLSTKASRRRRMVDNLEVKRDVPNMSGMMKPYRIWSWKQNELYRGIQEGQFEHLRKVYKRQWLEAFRVNADEYIYKYNQTKAAQLAAWEAELEDQDKQRISALHMSRGRQALRDKHRELLLEYHERQFFHWYERASERLQYFSKTKFIKREDLDEHIDRELTKYLVGKDRGHGSYPLNFVGQMPFLENEDLQPKEAPEGTDTLYESFFPEEEIKRYQPPRSLHDRQQAFPVSSEVISVMTGELAKAVDDVVSDSEVSQDEQLLRMAKESGDADEELKLKTINRGKLGARVRRFKSHSKGAGDLPQRAGPSSGPSSHKKGVKRGTFKTTTDTMKAYDQLPKADSLPISAEEAVQRAKEASGGLRGGSSQQDVYQVIKDLNTRQFNKKGK